MIFRVSCASQLTEPRRPVPASTPGPGRRRPAADAVHAPTSASTASFLLADPQFQLLDNPTSVRRVEPFGPLDIDQRRRPTTIIVTPMIASTTPRHTTDPANARFP